MPLREEQLREEQQPRGDDTIKEILDIKKRIELLEFFEKNAEEISRRTGFVRQTDFSGFKLKMARIDVESDGSARITERFNVPEAATVLKADNEAVIIFNFEGIENNQYRLVQIENAENSTLPIAVNSIFLDHEGLRIWIRSGVGSLPRPTQLTDFEINVILIEV